jgi:hypothetical protein
MASFITMFVLIIPAACYIPSSNNHINLYKSKNPWIHHNSHQHSTARFGSINSNEKLQNRNCFLNPGTPPNVDPDYRRFTIHHKISMQQHLPNANAMAKSISGVLAAIMLSSSPFILDHANAADYALRVPSKNPYDDLQPAGNSFLGNKGPNLQVSRLRGGIAPLPRH